MAGFESRNDGRNPRDISRRNKLHAAARARAKAAAGTGTDPKAVGVVALTITALLGTGYAAYSRYRGTYRP